MDLRKKISSSLKQAMKDKDTRRLSTLRLINAAIKDMEISKRGVGDEDDNSVSDAEILAILAKMIKQRNESARAYEEGGRIELAEQERAEIEIIQEFLPRQLTEDEQAHEIREAIKEADAESIRDMGKVMAILKSRFAGRMDFASAGPKVREELT